jgi:hypothetical protein
VDLGVPAIIGSLAGTVMGALIAHYAAKARGKEEHERALDMLVVTDRRREALAAIDAVRLLRQRIGAGDSSYGQMHGEWQVRILGPCQLIRDPDLEQRAGALGTILMITLMKPSPLTRGPLLVAAEDIQHWLEALLRREDPPAARLPSSSDILEAAHEDDGGFDITKVNDLIAQRSE